VPDTKFYRTGDLVRWTDEGQLEYLGRIDEQAKIRGYRIEPAAIESQLTSIEDLEQATVIVHEKPDGEKELLAFYSGNLNVEEVSKQMSQKLPFYMLPAAYHLIEKWPLTVNGKTNKKALLEFIQDNRPVEVIIAPTNLSEKKMAEIWAEVLGVELAQIGIDSNFFELGGQSLKAIRLVHRMNKELGTQIELSELFISGTIRTLCKKHPQDLFKNNADFIIKFNTPAVDCGQHLFYIPPIIGVPVGPDSMLMNLADYHTWGFNYTLEEDFVSYCSRKILQLTNESDSVVLMGYSSGGNIAFEVVKCLETAGRKIKRLVLIDSLVKKDSVAYNDAAVNQELKFWMEEMKYTKDFFSKDKEFYTKLIRSYAGYMAPLVNQGKINCPVHLLRSSSEIESGLYAEWSLFTSVGYQELLGSGAHHELFFPEYVAENSKRLLDLIRK
jgi:acyl carrier protein